MLMQWSKTPKASISVLNTYRCTKYAHVCVRERVSPLYVMPNNRAHSHLIARPLGIAAKTETSEEERLCGMVWNHL